MSASPRLRGHQPKKLQTIFMHNGETPVPEGEREIWLQEAAIQIAKTSPRGVDFLLSRVPEADELRLRAILLAMSFVAKKVSSRQRVGICKLARELVGDRRPMVVAEAVDTLSNFACRSAVESVSPLLKHASPYVVGSALRFFARCDPVRAVPLLEKALKAEEPIVRQNAVDELDEMNHRPALEKIKRLLRDPDKDVRQAARTAVAHLENGAMGQ